MSKDGSWRGCQTSFQFVDLQQQTVAQLMKDQDLQRKFFDLANKGMGDKPDGPQTSDPSGVAGAGIFLFNLIIVPSVFQ